MHHDFLTLILNTPTYKRKQAYHIPYLPCYLVVLPLSGCYSMSLEPKIALYINAIKGHAINYIFPLHVILD